MLSNLIDASGWTHEQWLAASIMVFIVLSVAVMLHRMVKLFRMSQRSRYQPNLRPLRRRRQFNTPASDGNGNAHDEQAPGDKS